MGSPANDGPCEYSAQLQYVKYHADRTNPDQSIKITIRGQFPVREEGQSLKELRWGLR